MNIIEQMEAHGCNLRHGDEVTLNGVSASVVEYKYLGRKQPIMMLWFFPFFLFWL